MMPYETLKRVLQVAQQAKERFVAEKLVSGEGRTIYDPVHGRVVLFAVKAGVEQSKSWPDYGFSHN